MVGSTAAVDLAKLDMALQYLQSSQTFTGSMYSAVSNGGVTKININHDGINQYNYATKTISWDPELSMVVNGAQGTGAQSAAVVLGHEFAHGGDVNFASSSSQQQENFALSKETQGANELHEPTRSTYDSVLGWWGVYNPTEHTSVVGGQAVWTETAQNGSVWYGDAYTGGANGLAPQISPLIDPGYAPPYVCTGYWLVYENASETDSSGHPMLVVQYIYDPVVLNLAGNAVATTSFDESGVRFDVQENGSTMKTGWLGQDEGFLVFGHQAGTPIDSAKDLVPHLGALFAMDSNHDGKLNAQDADWSQLAVWTDTHHGQFADSDLHSMAQLDIVSIELSAQVVNQQSNGNTILNKATFAYADGRVGEIASVELVAQPDNFLIPM
jgi:hypothetical protein